MKNTFIFTLFTVLLIVSCTKTVEPTDSNSPQELVVMAEIEAGSVQPIISLNSTFSNTLEPVQVRSTIFVDVTVNEELEPMEFRPLPDDNSIWKAPPELKIEEGNEYTLNIDASEFGFEILEGTSRVPVSGTLEVQNLSAPNVIIDQSGSKSQFRTEFSLTDNDEVSTYYHLTPYLILNDGSKLFLNIGEILSSHNAIIDMSHRHGILIDNSLVDEMKDVSLYMSVPHEFENLDLNLNFVYFELKTVPKDYFLFHRSIAQNIDSGASVFTLPTVTHTNFNSGYGLFATYTSQLDSIAIR